MKQILYSLFGYRFIYLGMSTSNLGRIKIGVARNVKLRWKAIGRSMRGRQFPIFSLPCFHALWLEKHLHRVMRRFNRPTRGDGGSEFYSFLNPFSWLGWVYVFCAIICAFLLSHLLLYFTFSGIYCWYVEKPFWEFQQSMLESIKSFLQVFK
ncbi:MAG: GIY-YIG nuclease family protein [Bacteroidota bacterium]